MTECERLILSGTFTRDFFKPEVRCDFLVDEKRKKIWAILLDLLLQFDKVCKENGLRYFLSSGTLLGAIRHNGFIPWDDDIDVVMPREDYDKLVSLKGCFSHPYLLQVPGENGYGFSFVKIRNERTTGVSDIFIYEHFNQGIFLDVFPLDNIKKEESRFSYNITREYAYDNSTCMRRSNPHLDEANRMRVEQCRHPDILSNLRVIDACARYYNNECCEYYGVLASAITTYEMRLMHKVDYREAKRHQFEMFEFPIPIGYDAILRVEFGDFMKFPPVDERGLQHVASTYLPDIPYNEYRDCIVGRRMQSREVVP